MMVAKSTPSLNEALIHRTKRSTAGIISRYNQTPYSLMLEEIKRLETRLENQISKTNVLEKELEGLKKENAFLKTELQSQLNNIKFIINKNNDKDIDSNDSNISQSAVNEQNVVSNLYFNVIRDKSPAALTPLSVPLNRDRKCQE